MPSGDGIRISGTFLSAFWGLASGALSAVATMFYWGGGTRAQLESLNRRMAEIESTNRLILEVLMKGNRDE